MTNGLKMRVPLLCGLAFDVEKDSSRKSGFRPAEFDLGAAKSLFGDLRLAGFAAALRTGFAEHLAIAGGDEGRYKGETVPVNGEDQPINRAWAIRKMLIEDLDIDADRISAYASRSNTGGNIAIFRDQMHSWKLDPASCGLMTNLYHLPRASMDLVANALPLQLFAAEALILVEAPNLTNELIVQLGEGPLAERCVMEIAGMADKLRGTYQPRTDAEAVRLGRKVSG